VLEISGSAAAEAVARRHPDLEDMPAAAPILSQIDWEMGRHQLAIDRLLRATKRDPGNFNVEDAYVGTELRMGKPDDARVAARQFLRTYPTKGAPQLHMLEAYGLRDGRDRDVWTTLCIRYLEQFRNDPAALGQLGSLAASNGWTDLAFVLYQESLQRSLDGFPFAIYYASSLVKAGDMAEADKVWNDLSIRNAAQLAEAPYVAAMVAWGSGRKSDAEPILASIRGQTVADLHRRRMIGDVFRSFGFAEMADRLAMP
jgi:tetratricopeptide (TPR) repeat protein